MWTITIVVSIFIAIFILLSYLCFRVSQALSFWREKGVPQKSACDIVRAQAGGVLMKKHFTEWLQFHYDTNHEAKYIGVYELTRPVAFLKDIELIKAITVADFDHFTDHRSMDMGDLEKLFSNSLAGLRGDKWRRVRDILTPVFSLSRTKEMHPLISECSNNFADYVEAETKNGAVVFDVKELFKRYGTDVIARCAFGTSVNSFKDRNNEFYTNGIEITTMKASVFVKVIFMRLFPRLSKMFKVRMFSERIETFFSDLVKETIEGKQREGTTKPNLIQLLAESTSKTATSSGPDTVPLLNEQLSLQEMTSQAFMFFFVGYETSAVALSFTAHLLAVNPPVQKKLQDEIDSVMNKSGNQPTYEDISEMKYLDAVIHETLRLYPPSVYSERLCTKQYELPAALPSGKPITIDPDFYIFIPVYQLHHDPAYFKEPEVFEPNRFLGDDDARTSPAYMPFGAGPRKCLAVSLAMLQLKSAIFHLLSRCNLQTCEKTQPEPMEFDRKNLQMQPKSGFWLKIESRNVWEVCHQAEIFIYKCVFWYLVLWILILLNI